MARGSVKISFDVSSALSGQRELKDAMNVAIDLAIRKAAQELLKDSRPFIPLLTGRLRDSGKLEEELEDFAYSLVWDAANPKNNFIYAEIQYDRVLQHVDGRYAAKWVEKTLQANPGKYRNLAIQFVRLEVTRLFGGRGFL